MSETITTGWLEREHNVPAWLIYKLEKRGRIPPARRAGLVRFWTADDLPQILALARQYGYGVEQLTPTA